LDYLPLDGHFSCLWAQKVLLMEVFGREDDEEVSDENSSKTS
jgi:hypothetical protein